MYKFTYDKNKFCFSKIIKEWLAWDKELSLLHEQKQYNDVFTRSNDQSTIWHQTFYRIQI